MPQSTQESSKSLEQKRAEHAWTAVKGWKNAAGGNKDAQAKYRTWAVKLPSLILRNGLLAALAFLGSKDDKQQRDVGRKCQDWLKGGGADVIPWEQSGDDVVQRLCDEAWQVYRIAQAEALQWAVWCKRFAEGYLEGGEQPR